MELQEIVFLSSDDAAEVNYTANSPSSSGDTAFQISFQNRDSPTGFTVTIGDVATNQPSETHIPLSLIHGSDAQWVLSGAESLYSTLHAYDNWMSSNLDTLGCQPLRQLCIPESHDAGMSQVSSHTFYAEQPNIQTQTLDIAAQLSAGI